MLGSEIQVGGFVLKVYVASVKQLFYLGAGKNTEAEDAFQGCRRTIPKGGQAVEAVPGLYTGVCRRFQGHSDLEMSRIAPGRKGPTFLGQPKGKKEMKEGFFKWLIKWFVIRLNLYLLWSKLHQNLFQKNRLPLPKISSVSDVEAVLGRGKYKADSWWVLWDVIALPEHTYFGVQNPNVAGIFGTDCDDFAVLAGALLQQIPERVLDVHILSMQYMQTRGVGGHNVCVFWDVEEQAWRYIGNWFGGRSLGRYKNEEAIIKEIVEIVQGKLLSWFTFQPYLTGGIKKYHIE